MVCPLYLQSLFPLHFPNLYYNLYYLIYFYLLQTLNITQHSCLKRNIDKFQFAGIDIQHLVIERFKFLLVLENS